MKFIKRSTHILLILIIVVNSFIPIIGNAENINNDSSIVIKFKDNNLYTAMKTQLHEIPISLGRKSKIASYNDTDKTITIIEEELEKVESIDLFKKEITDLEGIQNLKNLKTVYIDFKTYSELQDKSILQNVRDIAFSESLNEQTAIYFGNEEQSYSEIISETNNMSYINVGGNSATLTKTENNKSILELYNEFIKSDIADDKMQNIKENPNYVIFKVGENDFLQANKYVENNEKTVEEIIRQINNETGDDENSFTGALIRLIASSKNKWKNAKIIFVGTVQILDNGTDLQKVYMEKVKEICDTNGITYIDLYNEVNLTNEENIEKYSIGDGIHLNKLGYERFFVPKIEEALKYNTYYISTDGISENGLSEYTPMSMDTAKTKIYSAKDRILFKRGDTFYNNIDFSVSEDIKKNQDEIVKIANYGEGNLPLPLISAIKKADINSTNYWTWEEQNKLYKIDLSQLIGFNTSNDEWNNFYNIGFIECIKNNEHNKLYSVKQSLEELNEDGEFYCNAEYVDDTIKYRYEKYLYIKASNGSKDKAPTEIFGDMIFAGNVALISIRDNVEISGLNLKYTGGHAIKVNNNIYIHDNVIDNVGGSLLSTNPRVRYGNGIELFNSGSNTIVEKNIIRNVYDVAFTMQGQTEPWKNVKVINNIFVANSQNSEIWASQKDGAIAEPVEGYIYDSNISINQGRGWGYFARPNKKTAAEILFYGYKPTTIEMTVSNNISFNARRLYYTVINNKVNHNGISYGSVFGEGGIDSNNNNIYTTLNKEDSFILSSGWSSIDDTEMEKNSIDYNFDNFGSISNEYNIEKNSKLYVLNEEKTNNVVNSEDGVEKYKIENIALSSNKYDEIKRALLEDINKIINLNKYNIQNSYIKGIEEGTNAETILSNIQTNGTIEIYNHNNEKIEGKATIGTGMKLIVSNELEYNLVVEGDLNGDGKISITDLSKMKSHIIGKQILQGEYEKAADINGDGRESITDLSILKKYLIKK